MATVLRQDLDQSSSMDEGSFFICQPIEEAIGNQVVLVFVDWFRVEISNELLNLLLQ